MIIYVSFSLSAHLCTQCIEGLAVTQEEHLTTTYNLCHLMLIGNVFYSRSAIITGNSQLNLTETECARCSRTRVGYKT